VSSFRIVRGKRSLCGCHKTSGSITPYPKNSHAIESARSQTMIELRHLTFLQDLELVSDAASSQLMMLSTFFDDIKYYTFISLSVRFLPSDRMWTEMVGSGAVISGTSPQIGNWEEPRRDSGKLSTCQGRNGIRL
jgi:hypothetical protein